MVVETEDSTNFKGVGGNVANSVPDFASQNNSEARPVTVPQNQGAGQPVFSAIPQPAQPQSVPAKPQLGPATQVSNPVSYTPVLSRPIAPRPATSTAIAPATVPLFARPQQPIVQSMSAPPPSPTPPPIPTTQTSLSQQNQTQKQTYQAPSFSREPINQASAPPPKPPKQRRKLSPLAKRIGVGVLALLLVVGGSFAFFVSQTQQNSKTATTNTDPASRFDTLQLPLSELTKTAAINLEGGKTLSINGQLRVNNTLVLTPSGQPTTGIAGQIYYDQASNVLEYYNGTEFVKVASGTSLVQSLGGLTGAISVSGGLSASGNTITNSGVLSLQGQTGAVTLTAGNGITLDGTTISNSGVLTVGGQTGSINLGAGLSVSGGELKNSGVVGITAGTNITVVNNGNGSYTINSSASGGNVSTVGGTSGKIAKFTGVNTIADSLISETGGSIIISGDLDVTGQLDLGTPLEVINGGTGTNTLAANGVLVGNGISAVSAVTAGGTGLCFMSTAGAPAFSACPSAAGVDALNGLTGTLTIANAAAAGSTITINDASTSQKGIASFNSTNFSASSGAINTIQDINTTAAPTFGRLTVTSSQAASTMMLINNTNAAASGNLLDLQTNSVTQMSISPAGAMTLVGTINGQTISSTANFTGTLGVSGLASLSGGATVTGTLTANTITPTSSMTVGATGQSLLLQGNALTSLEATDSGNTTKLSFVTPTADVTYRLQTAAAGTYDICTTIGNCAGTGGGVTTLGGTTNRLSKFTGSQTIGDSIITDNGSTVTIGGTLSVNTLTPTSSLTVGATTQSFLLQGNASSTITSTDSGNTTTLSFQAPTANVIYRLPTAVAGTYDLCTTVGNCAGSGGGVTTLGGTAGRIAKFTAAQTIADSLLSETGSTVTVNGTLTANTITPTASMTVGATTQSFLLQGSATSTITSTDSGNTTTLSFVAPTANVTYRLQTATAGTYDICSSANNCGYANAALSNLSSVAINTTLLPGSAGAIDVGSNTLPFRDIYVAGSSATPGTNNFRITGTSTGARTITLPDASGTVCIDTNNCSYVSLQASSPGTAQTGNINVGGTIIAGTSMQAPLINTADATSGSTAALTLRTGDLTGGSSTATGNLTFRSGNASGTAQNSGNISIDAGTATGTTGTLSLGTANASAVSVGNTAAALSLYGTAASTMTFQNGANTTALSFQAPTANVTYRFPTAAAGSYDICTSVGNCAGSGGGVTTPGGTNGRIAKFTGSQTIADSLLSEAGSTITVNGNLNLTTGSQYQINGAQISSADLSNDANLAKLNITQTFTGATNSFKNSSDSTNAFNIQNTSSQSLLTADTAGNQIVLGTASSLAGKLTFQNATNANTISLIPAVATSTRTIILPDESGTICTTGSVCTGYAPSSGSSSYIQNQIASQQTANGWISGTLRADTSLQSPLIDTATTTALAIGTTNATAINLNQNTTIAADKYLAMSNSAFNGDIVVSQVTGDTNSRFIAKANGGLNWGPGNTTTDTNLYRDGVATLHTDGNLIAGGTVTVQGANSLTLGLTGTNTGSILFKGATAASGTLALIGQSNPSTNTLTLPNETGTICTTGSVCTGYAPSSGGTGYIQNTTTVQTNANIAIQGASDSSVTATIRERATQTADILRIEDNSGTAMLSVNAYGQLHVTQSSSFDSYVGVGMPASSGEQLRVGVASASTVGLSIYGDGNQSADLISITAGGVQPILTITGTGQAAFQNRTDSATALTVNNATTQNVFAVDTTNGQVVLGQGSSLAGKLLFSNATNGNTITLVPSVASANQTLTLPNETGTICTTGSVCTGYAPSSGSASYIQNQNSLQQTASNYWISGTGRADTSLQTPLLDTATAIALAIGTTNTTAINLNQNTVVAAAKTLVVTSGATTLTGAATGDALTVSNSTSTGNIAVFNDNATTVATIGNGGATTFQNSADSTAAFRVLNATGSSLFSIDSTNGGAASLLSMNSGETGTWNSATTSLPDTRAYAGTAIANGYVYVIGGNATTTAQSTVYYAKINANGTTGSWTTNTYALPVATAYTSAVIQNGYLYILGGSNSAGTEQTTVYFTRLNSDGSTGSWYTTTVLPAARSNGSAIAANGYMYYIGGQDSTNTAQNTTYYARINSDGTLGSWTTGSTITNARKSAQVAAANGYIYVAGGVDNAGNYQTSVYYAALNAGTGAIGTFATTSALPGARAEGSALVANGYMYVIGGRDTSTYQTSVYYSKLNGSDGTAGTWAIANSTLPAGRGGRSVFIANGYMYAIGGYDGSATTAAAYSSSVARVQIGASLDLVGLQTTNTTASGDTTQGSAGGAITAGNGTFVGTMQVQGMTNLSQGLNVNGVTTLEGNTYVAGTLSLSSTIAAYEGFENVTFPPSGGTGTWTTGGNANWARTTAEFEEGIASAASGAIADNQATWLDVNYTWSQSGSLTFAWKVSSEPGFDYLVVCVDKDSTCSRTTDFSYRVSGESGWQQLTIPMTAGAHSIRWLYEKDSSTATGSDTGWIDNIRFNGGEGKIVGNGINFSPATGYNVTIGDSDTTAALLVLDRYSDLTDPTGTNGGMYYNTSLARFRCFEGGVWKDCITEPLTTRLYASAPQSIPNATDTRLVFGSTDVNDAPITNTGDNEFTFDRAGRYEVSASVRYSASGGGTGERYLAVAQSVTSGQPSPRFTQQTINGSASYASSLNVSTVIDISQADVNAGYTISIYTFQNSGASLNTNSDWSGTNISITWLGY